MGRSYWEYQHRTICCRYVRTWNYGKRAGKRKRTLSRLRLLQKRGRATVICLQKKRFKKKLLRQKNLMRNLGRMLFLLKWKMGRKKKSRQTKKEHRITMVKKRKQTVTLRRAINLQTSKKKTKRRSSSSLYTP